MNVRISVLSLVLTAIFTFSHLENATGQNKNFTIVIDPGHGGKMPGTVSGRLLEKDLNLVLAKKFGALIEADMPEVEVIYTRTDDSDVGLAERGAIANRADADLFFSIHLNAHDNASANGSSTWVMGVSKSDANLAEAMRENEVIKFENDYTETYEGFDPSSPESYIIFNLMQYAHFHQSLALARIVQKHYSSNTPFRDRGAAQGPFVVLWKPAMPSVLTEVGFLSNEADRKYISSAAGQDAIARSLYDAFREYKELVGSQATTARAQTSTPPVPVARPVPSTNSAPASNSRRDVSPANTLPADGAAWYVQLSATRNRIGVNDPAFGVYRGGVVERMVGGWYKYSLGPFPNEREAQRALDEVRRGKFKDAFIVVQ